jgi:hypothetical protein
MFRELEGIRAEAAASVIKINFIIRVQGQKKSLNPQFG